MSKAAVKTREEARRLFLTGEMNTNAEIAARLELKPHTIGQWRRQEDWDGLRLKIDKRAAALLVEKIATDRVNLNLKHFKYWDVLLSRIAEAFKKPNREEVRELERLSAILDRAQKGQRLARGLSMDGQTEEETRAEAQAEIRRLIDIVIDSIKRNVREEEARDRIRQDLLRAIPEETQLGAGIAQDQGPD